MSVRSQIQGNLLSNADGNPEPSPISNYEEGAETRRLPPKQIFLYGEGIVQTTNIFYLAVKTVVCKAKP